MQAKFFLLVSFLILNACDSFHNRHDSLAVQCGINGRTENKILLKFTNPQGDELSGAQLAQLQVRYSIGSNIEIAASLSPEACVALPPGATLVTARIDGDAPLIGEFNLDSQALTGSIQSLALSAPGYLSLGLKCPKVGLLAAQFLDNIVEIKKANGRLNGYSIDLSVYDSSGHPRLNLFSKKAEAETLSLPVSYFLQDLPEGQYKIGLSVQDAFHPKNQTAETSQCSLTIRRSCASDETFDSETISCTPKLCDNAYRIGAKWKADLSFQRGEGQYECSLVHGKAVKSLSRLACASGYFKSQDSCLGAKQIAGNCAWLESEDVVCWGTQLAKDNYPLRKDINYQTTFRFADKIKNFGDRCVELESGIIHCWYLTYGDNARFTISDPKSGPKNWEQAVLFGQVNRSQSCQDSFATGNPCRFQLDTTQGQSSILPKPILGRGKCLVDTQGDVWCYQNAVPTAQNLADSQSAGQFYKIKGLPLKAIEARSDGYSSCVLLIDGTVMCWGDNERGGVGANLPAVKAESPTFVVEAKGRILTDIQQIHASIDGNSRQTNYALTKEGRVFAWGSNLDGTLANGTPGEDDEGFPLFSRYAVPVVVEVKNPVYPQ